MTHSSSETALPQAVQEVVRFVNASVKQRFKSLPAYLRHMSVALTSCCDCDGRGCVDCISAEALNEAADALEGRAQAPAPDWRAAESERRLIVRYIREVGASKHPNEATTMVTLSAATAHLMDVLATAIEFERHIPDGPAPPSTGDLNRSENKQ